MIGEKTTAEPNNVAFNGWDCNTKQIGMVLFEEAQVHTCTADPSSSLVSGHTAARKKKFSASRSHKLDGFSGERQRIVN